MSDIFSENHLSIAQVCKLLPPGRKGKSINFSTVYRWIFVGVNSHTGPRTKLDAIRCGGRWLVSRNSLQRFIDVLSAQPDANASAPIRTPSARKRANDAAKKKLAELGIG
jgi:hypothetical protein